MTPAEQERERQRNATHSKLCELLMIEAQAHLSKGSD